MSNNFALTASEGRAARVARIGIASLALSLFLVLPGAVRAEAEKPASTAAEAKKSVKEGARAVGDAARDTTRAIGHGTRDAARAIGHGARDGAKAVGEAARKTWKDLKGAVADE